ncbi:hypothetical protein ACFVOK_24940 [Streptomyces sp. NPDC057798]|uniref:Rv1733c family protein n=1 Tax=Streptomyces sp. NPDC057798 TaxID=3346252 RepID=UPI00368BE93F
MDGTEGTRKRMWRWRGNPLRRREDIVEAWIVLAVWVVAAVGGTLAGLATARTADAEFARQRGERHPVRAVLQADVPRATSASQTTNGQAEARIRWTDDNGTSRSGETLVMRGQKAGAEVVVWVDRRGDLAGEPLSRTEAAVQAGVLGAAAALALTGVVVGAGAAAKWRLDRRRIEGWGREWESVGPEWGRQTS